MAEKANEREAAYFIDKNYLLNSFVQFNKSVVAKQYYDIAKGNKVRSDLDALTGEYTGLSIQDVFKKTNTLKKTLITTKTLPMPASAEPNVLYLLQSDTEAQCNFFLYTTVKDEEGAYKWACLSSPSNVFEKEDLDFEEEFAALKAAEDTGNYIMYLSWDELKADIMKSPIVLWRNTEINYLDRIDKQGCYVFDNTTVYVFDVSFDIINDNTNFTDVISVSETSAIRRLAQSTPHTLKVKGA